MCDVRVFVAGGTGAVGRALVPLLIKAGHDVVGTSRTPGGVERLRAQGVTGVRVDMLDADDTRRAVAAAAPDVIMHQLTALGDADGRANALLRRQGTRNLVEAAKAAGVERIVVQSISWVYAPGETPARETEPLDTQAPEPRAGMVDAVRAMEETAAELPHAVVLRYGILYGPGTWYAPGGPVAAALAGDKEARFLGSLKADSSVSSFLHVADAANAALAALDWPSGPVNIVDDEPAPAHVWLPELARALCVPSPEPEPGAERPGWARGADNTLARSRGWVPAYPSWRTGFGRQLA